MFGLKSQQRKNNFRQKCPNEKNITESYKLFK